jgi:colanic acid/amylovoran biosynthesis glycosyltransferase
MGGERNRVGEGAMTLRIAIFVHEFPALSETFVLSQITGLLRLGCDIRIFATRRREEPMEHADVQRCGLAQRTVYLAMPAARLSRLAAAVPIIARHFLRSPRRTLCALNPWRYGRLAVSLELLFWLDRLAHEGSRFDVLLCHFGIIGRTVAFLREIGAAEGALVTVFHGVDVSVSLARRPDLYRHLFRCGDLFLPISARWRQRLVDHGCDPDLTMVHHMGVDLSRFAASPHHVMGDASLGVLTIGRHVEKKGIEFGLHAVALARDRGVRLRYTIIGDGPLRDSLNALANELDLAGVVNFVGWQDQEMVLAHIRRNQVLLAPSVTDKLGEEEGIPVTLMEAMATGMPVISTYHSGIPELVEDGVSGLLVEEGDVDGLAGALVELDRDPNLRDALGRRARKAIADGFDVRILNARLLEILKRQTGMRAEADGGRHEDLASDPRVDTIRGKRIGG